VIRTTPFHERLSRLDTQGLFTHWQGYLSALRYSHAPKHEYFAVRNGVGVFDTSPLYKYRICGPDAERFLGGVMARDIRACRPGRAQYTSGATTGGS
jgi:aminomethyltransferase